MKKTRLIFTIISIVFLQQYVLGQLTEFEYFGEESNGQISKVYDDIKVEDGIILAGKTQNGSVEQPLILKVSTDGEVLWSTLNNIDIPNANYVYFNIEYSDEGFVYGVSLSYSWPNGTKHLWKINSENGAVEWIEPFYGTDYSGIGINDYDSTRLLICYFNNSDLPSMAFIDKSSGDTLMTKSFSDNTSTSLHINKDEAGNILFARHGKLFKYNGDDWNEEIWKKQYSSETSEMNGIDRIYVDHYGDIYVFGRNGGSDTHGNGVIVKVNPDDGSQIWYTNSSGGDVSLADFADKNNYLFPTYRHTLVGGGTYYFRTSKIRKSDGVVIWLSTKDVTPLGATSTTSGNGESAISVDVDCAGYVYQTGYYGDANYGPEQWGIMKLQNSTGNKVYDHTITEDSSQYDNLSVGMVCAVFQNSPIFIGNLEYVTDSTKVVFVAVSPIFGEIVQRRVLGGDFLQPSETKEIKNDASHVYTLKQHSNKVIINKNDSNGNLIWDKELAEAANIKASRLTLSDNYVYVTTVTHCPDSLAPYYTDSLEQITLFAVDKISSDIIFQDSIEFLSAQARFIEVTERNDTAIVTFEKDNNIYFERWTSSGFSGAQLLESAPLNIDYDGHINRLAWTANNDLLYLSKTGIMQIETQTLAVTSIYYFPENVEIYDNLLISDTLFAAGNSDDDSTCLLAVNLSALSSIWFNKYDHSGSIFQIDFLQNSLLTSGTTEGHLTVCSLKPETGDTNWHYIKDSLTNPVCQPYTLSSCEHNQTILVGGSRSNNFGSDVIFDLLNSEGDTIETFVFEDDLLMNSRALTSELVSDSIFWLGGGINSLEYIKHGFIYHIGFIDTNTNLKTPEFKELLVKLYPNPTQDHFYVDSKIDQPMQVEVINLQGKVCVPLQTITEYGISLKELEDAIYFVRIFANDQQINLRLIKI